MSHTALTTVSDIQAFQSGIVFSTNTMPTLSQVSQWITEATAIVYSGLAISYDTTNDISNSDSLEILKSITNIYVLENISFAKDKTRTGLSNGNVYAPRKPKYAEFYDGLDKIINREILLPNVASSIITKSSSYVYDNSIAFVSDKEVSQW